MNFNISDVSSSVVSKFTFNLLACLMTSYDVSMAAHNGDWTNGSFALISIAGIILLAWLIWFFYMYLGGRKVVRIQSRPGVVVEIINWILFAIWIASDCIWESNPLWVVAAWCLFAFSAVYYAIYCQKYGNE